MHVPDAQLLSFTNEFDRFIRQRFNYKAELAHWNWGRTVNVSRARVSLYLRLIGDAAPGKFLWPSNTLAIARIEFREQRVGHGLALLEYLVARASYYGYDKIGVERTHSGENIQGFVRKFGFKPAWPESDEPESNWIIPVGVLAARLGATHETKLAA